jgi:hypothetical protein
VTNRAVATEKDTLPYDYLEAGYHDVFVAERFRHFARVVPSRYRSGVSDDGGGRGSLFERRFMQPTSRLLSVKHVCTVS